MKIYINTENQLPVFCSTLSTKTDEAGVLLVYEQGSSGSVSSLVFKRGTTVPIEFIVAGNDVSVDSVKDLTFGIKLAGKYDDFLVVEASAETGEAVEGGVSFTVSAVFDSQVIDNALAVNGDSSDDIESADFIGAVSWKNAAGEVTESATVDVEIRNNVIRDGDGLAGDGLPSGVQWTALMVVRMSWADYQALCEADEDREDVLYVCPDAPDKETELEDSISALEERVTVNESDISTLETNYTALEERVDNIDANGTGDLSGYAKLDTEQTWTAEQTFSNGIIVDRIGSDGSGGVSIEGANGVSIAPRAGNIILTTNAQALYNGEEIATKADIKDLTGYAKLDTVQTWTAAQYFSDNINGGAAQLSSITCTGGALSLSGRYGMQLNSEGEFNIVVADGYAAKLNGEEIATKADIKDVDLSGYAKLDGADFTGTLSVNGSEVALKSDIKDVDLSGYALLSGANFTGTLSVNGSEVALKSDLKDLDLTGYATEEWVKEYHSADIEELKEWVKEELLKTEAGQQAAKIEELEERIEELERAVYTMKITINVPEDGGTFVLADLMEGGSSNANYTGGEIPKYDFIIDWGDGSAAETYTNENWEDCSHVFDKAGEYLIRIQGTFEYLGHKGYADSDESLVASQLITDLWIA